MGQVNNINGGQDWSGLIAYEWIRSFLLDVSELKSVESSISSPYEPPYSRFLTLFAEDREKNEY